MNDSLTVLCGQIEKRHCLFICLILLLFYPLSLYLMGHGCSEYNLAVSVNDLRLGVISFWLMALKTMKCYIYAESF